MQTTHTNIGHSWWPFCFLRARKHRVHDVYVLTNWHCIQQCVVWVNRMRPLHENGKFLTNFIEVYQSFVIQTSSCITTQLLAFHTKVLPNLCVWHSHILQRPPIHCLLALHNVTYLTNLSFHLFTWSFHTPLHTRFHAAINVEVPRSMSHNFTALHVDFTSTTFFEHLVPETGSPGVHNVGIQHLH